MIARENLNLAWKKVRANKGAAGVDGLDIETTQGRLHAHWLGIEARLQAGTYRPDVVRCVEIPKAGGGTRKLGVPTVPDRFIQQALLQVLAPLIGPRFAAHSYGFRPGRSAHQAGASTAGEAVGGGSRPRELLRRGGPQPADRAGEAPGEGRAGDPIDPFVSERRRHARRVGAVHRQGHATRRVPVAAALQHPAGRLDRELEKCGHAFYRYADDCNVYVASRRSGERVMASLIGFLEGRSS